MTKAKQAEYVTVTMTHTDPPLLSPQRAFVVQFRAGTGADAIHFMGRAEHMISGQTAHFESVEDLVTFVTRVLAEVRD